MGVMITASHNPVHDNGFKFFNSNGNKLQKSDEEIIEGLIEIKKDFYTITLFVRPPTQQKICILIIWSKTFQRAY